jgi:hypothetical protein
MISGGAQIKQIHTGTSAVPAGSFTRGTLFERALLSLPQNLGDPLSRVSVEKQKRKKRALFVAKQ